MHQISLQQAIRRAEQRYSTATAAVRRAGTMREAVQAGQVPAPPELRGLLHLSQSHRTLQAALTGRLRTLLEAQLEEALQIDDADERKKRLAHWYLNDWQYLRGPHAALFREAETARLKLLRPTKP